jgi:hypothetical protein
MNVNGPATATILPTNNAPAFHVSQATTEPRAAGETMEKVSLWKGGPLTYDLNTDLMTATDTAVIKNDTVFQAIASSQTGTRVVFKNFNSVEQTVRVYFADLPILVRIAKCESHFRQYDDKGEVLSGVANYMDRGVMQINELYHNSKALTLGMDIHTLEGNLEYARHLYEQEGTRPWMSSSSCWSETQETEIARK